MNVLMLGGPNTGKSTFLVQLYGRMAARAGHLVARGAPADLKPIRDGLERLSSGLSLDHTPHTPHQMVQHLPAATSGGRIVDFNIPEYAGETLDDIVRKHRIPDNWRSLISNADQWLLFVRIEQFAELPELLNRPISEQASGTASIPDSSRDDADSDSDIVPLEPDSSDDSATGTTQEYQLDLPLDMRLVELLQMALHVRSARPRGALIRPMLTVVLSCWDENNVDSVYRPEKLASSRIPLLHSYVRSMWRSEALAFRGLSSQGGQLQVDIPDEEFVDNTPARQGYVIAEDGKHEGDLTLMIRVP